jgi:acyl-CoA thioester hydrolase
VIKTSVNIRVRYAETDQMGYVYYGNYAQYFEVARVEMLRELGFSYKLLEEQGVMLPVIHYEIKYYKPAFYDDLLDIKTTIPTLPSARLQFSYQTFNADGVLLNEASTTLVFINRETGRPCRAPSEMLKMMESRFRK